MINILKWKMKPSGACPVQAEGWFLGKYFYFRSRFKHAVIQFADSEHDWDVLDIKKQYVLFSTKDDYGASWIPTWFAYALIFKGCIKFLLNFKSNV